MRPRMSSRPRTLAMLALSALLGGCGPTIPRDGNIVTDPHGQPDSSSLLKRRDRVLAEIDRVDDLAAALIEQDRYPGLAVGVILDGELVWTGGYGVASLDGRPVDQHTVFRIASLTKTITGLALLKLRDDGRLRLDAPATDYLPELGKVAPLTADAGPITLRHLITHTSGLPRVGTIDYTRPGQDLTEAEILGSLEGLKLEAAPGSRAGYSNLGLALVGLTITRAAGRNAQRYITDAILHPLGMRATRWRAQSVPKDRLAIGYAKATSEAAWAPKHHWRMGAGAAMGGLYSSVADMARYVAFQQAAWPPRDAPDPGPVRRSTVRETHRVAGFGRPGRTMYGMAWGIGTMGPDLMLTHLGSTWQYAAAVRILPERGLGIIALANGPHSRPLASLAWEALTHLQARLGEVGLIRTLRVRAVRPLPLPTR